MVAAEKPRLLINVPYDMVQENLARLTALGVGAEIYLDNRAVGEVGVDDARKVGHELMERGILCTVHAPYMDLSPGGVDRDVRRLTQEKLKKAVDISLALGAAGIVCHGGYDKWRFDGHEEWWLESSVETWSSVLEDAGDGLPVIIENIFEETPATLIALLDHFREKNLWFCFDTGHFNLFTAVPLESWLGPLKGRLKEFHIHDNHGRSDEHLPIGQGTFPFRELRHLTRSLHGILFTAEAADIDSAMETIRCAKEFLY